jgi:hypothetical protein
MSTVFSFRVFRSLCFARLFGAIALVSVGLILAPSASLAGKRDDGRSARQVDNRQRDSMRNDRAPAPSKPVASTSAKPSEPKPSKPVEQKSPKPADTKPVAKKDEDDDRDDRSAPSSKTSSSGNAKPGEQKSAKSTDPKAPAKKESDDEDDDERSGVQASAKPSKKPVFVDEDEDGAPDTLADLFKIMAPKPAPAPAPPAPSRPVVVHGHQPAKPVVPAAGRSNHGHAKAAATPAGVKAAQGTPVAQAATTASKAPVSLPAKAAAPSSAATVSAPGQRAGGGLSLPDLPQRPADLLAVDLSPEMLSRARHLGYTVGPPEQLPNLGMVLQRVFLPPGTSPRDAMGQLRTSERRSIIAPNSVYKSIRSADDAAGGRQSDSPAQKRAGCAESRCYAPQAINWQPDLGKCARKVRVGVIDTGIDAGHPTFQRRIHVGSVQDGTRRVPHTAHGTGVLAVMAGDPRSSTPGLIPEADFFAVDIFYADKDGAPISDTAHLLRALDLMEAWDIRVVNLSLTGPRDELVEKAVARLAQNGVLIVAAAGNDGPGAQPAYPAAYPQVIAVTAVNREKRAYRQANHGTYIDVAAPGVDIWTALPNERQGTLSGTSLAAPFVASVVASLYTDLPQKTKAAALARLSFEDLGQPGRDPVYGNGLLVAPSSCGGSRAPVVTASPPPAKEAPITAEHAGWATATTVTRPAANALGFR